MRNSVWKRILFVGNRALYGKKFLIRISEAVVFGDAGGIFFCCIVGVDQVSGLAENVYTCSSSAIFFLIGNDALENGFTLLRCFDHTDTAAVLVGERTVQGDKPLGITGRFGIYIGTVRSCEDFFPLAFLAFSIHSL